MEEVYEEVKTNLRTLHEVENPIHSEDDEHEEGRVDETRKEIICPFFQEGGYSPCKTCFQPTDKLEECTTFYKETIHKTPMLTYSNMFGITREREAVADINGMKIGMLCDSCYFSDNCAVFESGAKCGVDWTNKVDESDPKSVIDNLIRIQNERINRAQLSEKMDGGVPDGTMSTEMDRLTGLLAQKHEMSVNKTTLKIEASTQGDQKGPGLLESIFGGMVGGKKEEAALPEKTEDVKSEIIDVTPTPVEPEKPKKGKRRIGSEN